MNERIKELSTIAKNLTTDDAIHLSHIHNRTLSLDELEEIFAEKFAELIVGECCQKLENDGMVEVAMELKEHFGVEL